MLYFVVANFLCKGNKMKKISFLSIVLFIGVVLAGAFYEYVSCALSIALVGYLFYL